MTDETIDALAALHPCDQYMQTHGTMELLRHLWDHIAQTERLVGAVKDRQGSDAMAAALSRGGGHGFG